jgi:hypothetical protein
MSIKRSNVKVETPRKGKPGAAKNSQAFDPTLPKRPKHPRQRGSNQQLLRVLGKERNSGTTPTDLGARPILERLGDSRTLDGDISSRMQSALGTSLSGVRVHSNPDSFEQANKLGARAFTIGEDIAFARGEYKPGTLVGQALIAHELAHVLQQRGAEKAASIADSDAGATEADADRATVGILLALWGGTRQRIANISAAARPALKSGLRLQRCVEKVPAANEEGLKTARENFESYNTGITGDLNKTDINRIHEAIKSVAGDNAELMVAFYHYYGSHEINKWSGRDLKKAREKDMYADTSGGSDTNVDPRILDPDFPVQDLGTLLIHELVHTRHVATNWMGAHDFLEGEAHAVEFFLAMRSGAAKRVKEIQQIAGKNIYSEWGSRYRKTLITMDLLYKRIDGRALPQEAPEDLKNMKPEKARLLVAELVTLKPDARSEGLQALTRWVDTNITQLKTPF